MNFFNKKYFLFALISGIILLVIVAYVIILSFNDQGKNQQPTSAYNQPVTSGEIVVKKIDPSESKDLPTGKPYAVTITFENPVSVNQVVFSFIYFDLTHDSEEITLKTTANQAGPQTITLKTIDPIKPLGKYTLTMLSSDKSTVLASAIYHSGNTLPTRIPSNSPSLAAFLPHEESSFSLIFLPEKNLYVFHFKYDKATAGTLNDQYEKAKQNALIFIKSKGIDPASVIIDFRRS